MECMYETFGGTIGVVSNNHILGGNNVMGSKGSVWGFKVSWCCELAVYGKFGSRRIIRSCENLGWEEW